MRVIRLRKPGHLHNLQGFQQVVQSRQLLGEKRLYCEAICKSSRRLVECHFHELSLMLGQGCAHLPFSHLSSCIQPPTHIPPNNPNKLIGSSSQTGVEMFVLVSYLW